MNNSNKKQIRQIIKHIVMMKMAVDISKLSYDPKHRVGSILAKNDYTDINAIGYNGTYVGGENKRESMESGESGFIHAEANMLINTTLNRDTVKDYTVFLTLKPCMNCAKMLINKGVKRIVILDDYLNSKSEELLCSVGIETVFLKNYFVENMKNIHGDISSSLLLTYKDYIDMFLENRGDILYDYNNIPEHTEENIFEIMFDNLWKIW